MDINNICLWCGFDKTIGKHIVVNKANNIDDGITVTCTIPIDIIMPKRLGTISSKGLDNEDCISQG